MLCSNLNFQLECRLALVGEIRVALENSLAGMLPANALRRRVISASDLYTFNPKLSILK